MKILYSILLAAIFPVLMFSTGGLVHAQQEENATSTSAEPTFLFIQQGQSGSISDLNATAYTLDLNNVSDMTILFSERPDRILTSVSTSNFVGNWTAGQDSFAADPPNAVLVVHDDEERQDIAIVELLNPKYDTTTNSITYDTILENATSLEMQNEFGQSTLVIDQGEYRGTRTNDIEVGPKIMLNMVQIPLPPLQLRSS